MKKFLILATLLPLGGVYGAPYMFSATGYLNDAAMAWAGVLDGFGTGGAIAARVNPMYTDDASGFADFVSRLAYNDTALTLFESNMHMDRALKSVTTPLIARRGACPANMTGCTNIRRSLVVDVQGGASFSDYDKSDNSDFKTKTTDFLINAKAFISDGFAFGIEYTRTDTKGRSMPIDISGDGNSVTLFAQYLGRTGYFANIGINAGTIGWQMDKNIAGIPDNEDFNNDFWGGQINTGVQISAGQFIMTPQIGMRYMRTTNDAHTDDATQHFAKWWYNTLRAMAGATIGFDFIGVGFVFRPTVTGGATYDIISHGTDSVSVYLPGDNMYFIPVNTPARTAFAGGAGLGVYGARAAATLEYQIDIRTDYRAHNGMLRAKIVF